jgi:dienelactone hydrolase
VRQERSFTVLVAGPSWGLRRTVSTLRLRKRLRHRQTGKSATIATLQGLFGASLSYHDAGSMASDRMIIDLSPNPALVDQEVRIRVSGAPPEQRVRLLAWTMDDSSRRWESTADFIARSDGTIDLGADAAIDGSYRGVDPMGLFWSLALNPGDAGQHDQYLKKELTPSEFTIEASAAGVRRIARARLERHFVRPGTMIRAVDEPGLAGLLFIPSREGGGSFGIESVARLPTVITVGGSGGGLDWEIAAALASHGFAAFALPYFGFDPLPASLNSIPLEYFERAIAWLGRQPEVDAGRLAIHGTSRGGELALLLASRIPLLRAVAGIVPGNVVWQGTGRPPDDDSSGRFSGNGERSSWTHRGAPLPFVPYRMSWFRIWTAARLIAFRKPVRFVNLHRDSFKQREVVARAAIEVEKIRAPILLVSAGADLIWPSEFMAEAIEERLAARQFKYEVKHLRTPGAGHALRLPHTPATTLVSKIPTFGFRFAFGGTSEATARARVVAWRETLAFFRRHLQ